MTTNASFKLAQVQPYIQYVQGKVLMDGQRITEDQHADKKLKMQCEVDMERTRSSERIAQIGTSNGKPKVK